MTHPARPAVLILLAALAFAPPVAAQPASPTVNTYDAVGHRTGTIDRTEVQGRPGTPFPNSFGLVKVQVSRGEVIVLGSALGAARAVPPPVCSKLTPANPSGNKGTNGIGGDCASPVR